MWSRSFAAPYYSSITRRVQGYFCSFPRGLPAALAAGREKGSRLPLSVPRPRRLHAHRLSEGVQGAGYSRWAKASATVLTP